MANKNVVKKPNLGWPTLSGAVHGLSSYLSYTFLGPIAAGVMIGAAGFMQGLPWFFILIGMVFAFACAATGLLRFDELKFRRDAAEKFTFQTAGVAFDLEKDADGAVTSITRAQVVFLFQSMAPFGLSYVLDEISTSVDGRVNPKPTYEIRSGEIGAMGTLTYRDAPIDMTGDKVKPRLEAKGKIKLRYGYPGRERHTLEKTVTVHCVYDEKEGGYSKQNFLDAPQ
jgi:hypothetical protein